MYLYIYTGEYFITLKTPIIFSATITCFVANLVWFLECFHCNFLWFRIVFPFQGLINADDFPVQYR